MARDRSAAVSQQILDGLLEAVAGKIAVRAEHRQRRRDVVVVIEHRRGRGDEVCIELTGRARESSLHDFGQHGFELCLWERTNRHRAKRWHIRGRAMRPGVLAADGQETPDRWPSWSAAGHSRAAPTVRRAGCHRPWTRWRGRFRRESTDRPRSRCLRQGAASKSRASSTMDSWRSADRPRRTANGPSP